MGFDIPTKVKTEFPGRDTQIDFLFQELFEEDDSGIPLKYLLHGPPNTGKTAILKKLLNLSCKFYIYIDCMECYPSNLLFQIILEELSEKTDVEECNNFVDLLNCFKNMSLSETRLDFFVIKNCSTFGDDSYIQSFIRFHEELTRDGWNFPLIFIDQNTSAYGASVRKDIARIFFPCYNKDELFEVIPFLRPNYPREIFQNFLRVFISCVNTLYRDLFEILQLADVAFAHYKKPIDDGKIQADNLQALYQNIVPLLKVDSDNLFFIFPQSLHPDNAESMKISKNLEMGKVTKYVLVAAYIASFVSSKYDKPLFSKKSSKQKKQKKLPNANCTENKVSSLVGPKQFSFNRLLYIFNALSRRRNDLTADLIGQVASLVELKLIQYIENEDGDIDQPHYKCLADFDYVSAIAKSFDCDIERYLLS